MYVTTAEANDLLAGGREGQRRLYNLLVQAERRRGSILSGGQSVPGYAMPGGPIEEEREKEEQAAWSLYYEATSGRQVAR